MAKNIRSTQDRTPTALEKPEPINSYSKDSTTLDSFRSHVTAGFNIHRNRHRDSTGNDTEIVAAPDSFYKRVGLCREIYKNQGLIRNFIDTQTDFVCDNVEIIHPVASHNRFLQAWAKKVDLQETVNKMARLMLRDYNLVGQRKLGRITKAAEKNWKSVSAQIESIGKDTNPYGKRVIPVGYDFKDIMRVRKKNGKLYYRIKDESLLGKIRSESWKSYRFEFAEDYEDYVLLNEAFVLHHKKDDWETWSDPFLACVLGDVAYKNKLKVADIAVLDRVINLVRIWKLGDHKEKAYPNPALADKLDEILQDEGDGLKDIIWDSMIEVQELEPPVDKILGAGKYEQVNKDILLSLGIPEALLGGSANSKLSSSFIQLKSLVERLKYIRARIYDWLYGELKIVCQNMGIPKMPFIRLSQINLDDESMTKRLILNLYDRGILSSEAVLKVYQEDVGIEVHRMEEENKLYEKAGLEKLTPLRPPINEFVDENDTPAPTKKGPGTQDQSNNENNGRPPGRKDTQPRKRRTPKIQRSIANEMIKAQQILDDWDKNWVPKALNHFGKSNLRKTTLEEREALTKARHLFLANQDINASEFSMDGSANKELYKLLEGSLDSSLTTDQQKIKEMSIWAEYHQGR